MRIALPVALVLAVASGCAPAIPPLPGKGGPAWIELESDHFTIWTDAGKERGTELMKEVEDLRQVVIGTAFRGAAGDGRGFIIAFANDSEIHAYLSDMFAAMTIGGGGPFGAPLIVLSANSNSQNIDRTTTHELVHLISYGVIHRQPHWFAEGIAKYFETIEIDARAGTADVGRAATGRDGHVIPLPHLTSVDAIMQCQQQRCMNGNFYATAWALFTYLANVRPADLAKLEALLDQSPGDGRAAFAQVFGADGTTVIDGEMRRWLQNGSHTVLHFDVHLASHDVRTAPLADADVLAARAMLTSHLRRDKTVATQQIDAALALDPTDVMARIVELGLPRPHDAAGARATAAAHPGDWRAWLLLVTAAPTADEQAAARVKLCELAAAHPTNGVPALLCPTAPPS